MRSNRYLRFVIATNVFWAFVTLLSPSLAMATSIVALADPHHHRIILAADSKFVGHFIDANRHIQPFNDVICKIINKPDCIVAVSGEKSQSAQHFDLFNFVSEACDHSGDLHTKAKNFQEIAEGPVTNLIEYLREKNPSVYAFYSAGRDFVDALFVGIQDGHLHIILRGFRIDPTTHAIIPIEGEYSDTGPDIQWVVAGFNNGIVSYIRSHKDWDKKIDAVDAARKFINIEIGEVPSFVGPPISILQIDKAIMRAESHWVERGACDQKQPNQKRAN
jgi:hypothetical protein